MKIGFFDIGVQRIIQTFALHVLTDELLNHFVFELDIGIETLVEVRELDLNLLLAVRGHHLVANLSEVVEVLLIHVDHILEGAFNLLGSVNQHLIGLFFDHLGLL